MDTIPAELNPMTLAMWVAKHQVPKPETAPTPPGRYMRTADCAAYIGRSVKAVQRLAERRQIPHAVAAGRRQFDREAIDRWMARQSRRAFSTGR